MAIWHARNLLITPPQVRRSDFVSIWPADALRRGYREVFHRLVRRSGLQVATATGSNPAASRRLSKCSLPIVKDLAEANHARLKRFPRRPFLRFQITTTNHILRINRDESGCAHHGLALGNTPHFP
jgi:hypothetical protein